MPVRKLIFGGSFNPIHHGHLICARAVAEKAGYDRIVLMPSAQPPHKMPSAGNDLASTQHRLRMCEAAIEGIPGFEISELELNRSGPSYTIDSVRELKHQMERPTAWLVGADMALTLPTWHEAEALLRETHFVLIARPGSVMEWDRLPSAWRVLRGCTVAAPLIDISATDIRNRVARAQSIDFLTPPAVCRYIREHHLYAASAPAAGLTGGSIAAPPESSAKASTDKASTGPLPER